MAAYLTEVLLSFFLIATTIPKSDLNLTASHHSRILPFGLRLATIEDAILFRTADEYASTVCKEACMSLGHYAHKPRFLERHFSSLCGHIVGRRAHGGPTDRQDLAPHLRQSAVLRSSALLLCSVFVSFSHNTMSTGKSNSGSFILLTLDPYCL